MTENQKKFLVLRADGMTFDNIALKLKVTKPTLMKWAKLFKDDLNDLKCLAILALKEQYKYTQKNKYETLLRHLNKVDEAIEKKDLSKVSIKDLLALKNDILESLNITESNTNFINIGLEDLGFMEQLELTKKQIINIEETII